MRAVYFIIPFLLFITISVPVNANIIQNSSFELGSGSDADVWVESSSFQGSGVVLDYCVCRSIVSGQYVMNMSGHVVSPSSTGVQTLTLEISQSFSSTNISNVSFIYSVQSVQVLGLGSVYLYIYLYDGSSAVYSDSIQIVSTGQFTYSSQQILMNASKIVIQIRLTASYSLIYGQGRVQAIALIDDVYVYEAPPPPPPPQQPSPYYIVNVSEPTGHTFIINSTNEIFNATWDDVKKDLLFFAAGAGNVSVYVGKWGSPRYVYVGGSIYTQWVYDHQQQYLWIYGVDNQSRIVLDWPEPSSLGGGGLNPGSSDPRPPVVYEDPRRLPIVEGVFVLFVVLGSVYLYRYIKRMETRSLRHLRTRSRSSSNLGKKWKKRLNRGVKWFS